MLKIPLSLRHDRRAAAVLIVVFWLVHYSWGQDIREIEPDYDLYETAKLMPPVKQALLRRYPDMIFPK